MENVILPYIAIAIQSLAIKIQGVHKQSRQSSQLQNRKFHKKSGFRMDNTLIFVDIACKQDG